MTDLLRSRRDTHTRAGLLRAVTEADTALRREQDKRPQLADGITTWRRSIAEIPGRLQDVEARVAVVGAVKSGKSTLINALIGQDLLPRGSGILTAQITSIRSAEAPALQPVWKSRSAANRDFSSHMRALGGRGEWDLADPDHRRLARSVLASGGHQAETHREPLRAMLDGFDRAWAKLGDGEDRLEAADPEELRSWAAREEVAVYLAGLRVEVVSPDIPRSLVLLDCQGSDAWNAAHAEDLESVLLHAHALVYVVSSRVGLREADFRLLRALDGYGLLDLTRFAVNVDFGEVRDAVELERVLGTVRRRLRDSGAEGEVCAFSALQALLERELLFRPERIGPGESRLLDAWEAACPGCMEDSRGSYRIFREALLADARLEQEHTVLVRARADLRHALVAASRALQASGTQSAVLDHAAWETAAVEPLLTWAQQRVRSAAKEAKTALGEGMRDAFAGRRAPQRQAWEQRWEALSVESSLEPGDPGSEAGLAMELLVGQAEDILRQTEPLRINAIRNFALEARGTLAQAGGQIAGEAAATLRRAGVACSVPPASPLLSRHITATRRIPLFRFGTAPGETLEPTGTAFGGWLGKLPQSLAEKLPGRKRDSSQLGAERASLFKSLRARWESYLTEVLESCLVPHVEDAASQVFDCVAAWILTETRVELPDGLGKILSALEQERDPSPAHGPDAAEPLRNPERDPGGET